MSGGVCQWAGVYFFFIWSVATAFYHRSFLDVPPICSAFGLFKGRLLAFSSCSVIWRGNSGSSSRAVTGYPEGDIIGGTRNGRSASTLYQRPGISRGESEIRLPVIVAISLLFLTT